MTKPLRNVFRIVRIKLINSIPFRSPVTSRRPRSHSQHIFRALYHLFQSMADILFEKHICVWSPNVGKWFSEHMLKDRPQHALSAIRHIALKLENNPGEFLGEMIPPYNWEKLCPIISPQMSLHSPALHTKGTWGIWSTILALVAAGTPATNGLTNSKLPRACRKLG